MSATHSGFNPSKVPSNRAAFSPGAWILLASVLILGLAFDLGSKCWSFNSVADHPVTIAMLKRDPEGSIPPHNGVHMLPWNLLDLRLVVNHGAVFGIAPNKRLFFIVFTIGALGAGLLVFGRFTGSRDRLAHIAVGLILAGGLGNLFDRIVIGVVRDFLHMLPGWHLPGGLKYPPALGGGNEIFPWVFNVADVMLLTGMAMLMLHINRVEHRRKVAEKAAAESETASSTRPVQSARGDTMTSTSSGAIKPS